MFEKMFEKRSKTITSSDFTITYDGNNSVYSDRFKDMYYCRCLNALGDSVAKIPIQIKKDTKKGRVDDYKFYLNNVLFRMSNYFTSFETIKNFVMMAKDKGNAGLYIVRENGKVTALFPVEVASITVDDMGILRNSKNSVLVDFNFNNQSYSCLDKDIILFRDNNFYNELIGKSNKDYINNSVTSNVEASKYQATLFKSGMTPKLAVQTVSDIQDNDQLKKIKRKFNNLLNAPATDEEGNNRIFPIPVGFTVTPLNLKLADSQFSELKLQGKQDICNAVGVPIKLVDGTITEDEMNVFYSNVVNPFICLLEQEMNYKLLTESERKRGYKIRFNLQAVLKTSLEKQMQILTGYVKGGIYCTDEARAILGLESVEGGDTITLPSGQVSLQQIKNGDTSYLNKTQDSKENEEKGEEKEDGEGN